MESEIGVTGNRRQDVIEVMGDAARQGPERLQALRLSDGAATVVLDVAGLDRLERDRLELAVKDALRAQPGVSEVRVAMTADKPRRRIIAVGTTTTRALESAINDLNEFQPLRTRTNLTITPGYRFKAVDALLTNFHLPKSSLLILVSTFGGHELIMKAYEHAVGQRYRFYSYGDCMLIE